MIFCQKDSILSVEFWRKVSKIILVFRHHIHPLRPAVTLFALTHSSIDYERIKKRLGMSKKWIVNFFEDIVAEKFAKTSEVQIFVLSSISRPSKTFVERIHSLVDSCRTFKQNQRSKKGHHCFWQTCAAKLHQSRILSQFFFKVLCKWIFFRQNKIPSWSDLGRVANTCTV